MDNSFFVFAPDGGYFYNTPKRYIWLVLLLSCDLHLSKIYCDRKIGDQELSALIEKTEVSKWLWAAFGPGVENHLLTYLDKDGNPQGCKDPSIPL